MLLGGELCCSAETIAPLFIETATKFCCSAMKFLRGPRLSCSPDLPIPLYKADSFYLLLYVLLQPALNFQKYDTPVEATFSEEGVSQQELDSALNGFFEGTKPKRDRIEEFEGQQGLKDVPLELLKHLSSEYRKQEENTLKLQRPA
jgi:hypothetical protein